ncbi:VWA domain-containing protein [Rhodovarius crocodyli]|uniref:VWA domain-containing protein n=1 Tax=Rhodovarius crocodyli TaxID=1979269 RepID=A0A437MH60_9PROT|nr:VWA domain-containing protein [Rhodovarius crocodyli]RVT97000.1 VWA domain-containing protein [Rhodovarius crocodyli]
MSELPARTGNNAVAAFLNQARAVSARPAPIPAGRLLFLMDATASRQPTWDTACSLMAGMFAAVGGLGGLSVQLAYFRGHAEFAATPFLADAEELTRRMGGVRCLGGHTQILRALTHALEETRRLRVHAVVLVGDALEEALDPICHLAGQLGIAGTPVFAFHEGGERVSAEGFRQIAKLSGGAFMPFDSGSAGALRDLLKAVAIFAAKGRAGLGALPGGTARGLLAQLPGPR